MLSVMLNDVMLNVANSPVLLSVVILNAIMLSVVAPTFYGFMLNAMLCISLGLSYGHRDFT